ncbi:HYR domain-containing protein, partial [Sulfitobacter sp.]|uniref:HYR domain-containing protein n=1 Tax=Sulfitobacter sp. TaxID=1903071 RepID=UPI0035643706
SLVGNPDPNGVWTPALAGQGTYTYTHEAVGDCPEVSAEVVVTEQPAPVAGTTTDFSICEGGSVTEDLLNASITGNDIGSWNTTSGGAGIYTYTVTAIAPCSTDATVTVEVTEQDIIVAQSFDDQEECDSYTLTKINSGNQYFTESGGEGTELLEGDNITESQTIYVYATASGSCPADESSFKVTINPTPKNPVLDSAINTSCGLNNGSISLLVTEGIDYSIDGENYVTSGEFDNLAPGTYFITARFVNGDCISTPTEVEILAIPDTEDPVISEMGDIIVNVDPGDCGAVISFEAPTATDNCTGTVVTLNEGNMPSGSLFPVGTTTVTYTATDATGNTSTITFDVTVEDNEDPTIECPENITVTNIEGQDYAIVTYTEITATDNCGVTVERISGFASGEQFPIGTTTVTYVATDSSGNEVECSFTVLVKGTPVAVNDEISTNEDTSVIIKVLDNDSDPDGDELTIVSNTNTSNGTLVLNGDGTFTYTPNENYNGPDSFTYTISDGNGGTDTA